MNRKEREVRSVSLCPTFGNGTQPRSAARGTKHVQTKTSVKILAEDARPL